MCPPDFCFAEYFLDERFFAFHVALDVSRKSPGKLLFQTTVYFCFLWMGDQIISEMYEVCKVGVTEARLPRGAIVWPRCLRNQERQQSAARVPS